MRLKAGSRNKAVVTTPRTVTSLAGPSEGTGKGKGSESDVKLSRKRKWKELKEATKERRKSKVDEKHGGRKSKKSKKSKKKSKSKD